MTSFWAIDETSSTRSTVSNVAARSMPPSDCDSSPISFSTSPGCCVGSPITTLGGSPIMITLIDVAPARVLDELGRHRLGLVEPARFARRITHRQRAVEHDHRCVRSPAMTAPNALEKRLGHRRDDQEDDQGPDRQEQPLLDPQPPAILADGRQQEPHRRPGDFPVLAPIQEMDDDRHPGRRQPIQQRGVGKSQGPDADGRDHGRRTPAALSADPALQITSGFGPIAKPGSSKARHPGSDRCASGT